MRTSLPNKSTCKSLLQSFSNFAFGKKKRSYWTREGTDFALLPSLNKQKKKFQILNYENFLKGSLWSLYWKGFFISLLFFDDLNGILPPLLCLPALLENCVCRCFLLSSRLFCSNFLSSRQAYVKLFVFYLLTGSCLYPHFTEGMNGILALSWINTNKLCNSTRYYWFKCILPSNYDMFFLNK